MTVWRRIGIGATALISAALVGCGGPSGYRVDLPPVKRLSDTPTEDRAAYERFAQRLVASEGAMRTEGAVLIPEPVQATLGTLLKAAEGPTWTGVAETLGQPDADPDSLSAWHRAYATQMDALPGRPVRGFSSAWMIWPIPLDPVFAREAKAFFGTHLERLGSAGITAQNSINEWVKSVGDGRDPPFVVRLDRADMMLLVAGGAVHLTPAPKALRGVRADGQRTYLRLAGLPAGQGNGWRAVAVPTAEGLEAIVVWPTGSEPLPTLFSRLDEVAAGRGDWKAAESVVDVPAVRLRSTLDLAPALKAMGAKNVFDGPVDLRKMSIELYGDYRFARMTHAASLSLTAPGEPDPAATPGDTILDGTMLIWVREQELGVTVAFATVTP